jgi:hypothetical protein
MKKTPYFFILFLVLILIFILGVRYGQKIEKNNKIVDYILKISPYPIASPKPTDEDNLPTKVATASPTLKLKK